MNIKLLRSLFKNRLVAVLLLVILLAIGAYIVMNEQSSSPNVVKIQKKQVAKASVEDVPDEASLIKADIEAARAEMAGLIEQQTAIEAELARLREQAQETEKEIMARERDVKALQGKAK